MRGSRNFRQVSLTKRSFFFFLFFCFFLVLSLFYRRQMVSFKEIYHFSRFQSGSNIFQGGGSNFFQGGGGGSNCLFPIETHITCDFPGWSGPPVSPSGSALALQKSRSLHASFTNFVFLQQQNLEYNLFKTHVASLLSCPFYNGGSVVVYSLDLYVPFICVAFELGPHHTG